MSLAKSEGDVTSEALLLRAMRKEDAGFAFYQKTQNMCEMHKNRQNSVDSISNICFDVGMDARQMKKVIQLDALEKYREYLVSQLDSQRYAIMQILDLDSTQSLTGAQWDRFMRVLNEMIEKAESKV